MSDAGLRACSYGARGLWQDLLCIAGTNKHEYGFVSLNGRKLSLPDIARMTNGTEPEVVELLTELERNGVFSIDRRGIIYCRRMVRAEKNRSNGRLGGNPNLLKNKEEKKSVEHIPKPLIPEPEPRPKQDSLFPDGNSARGRPEPKLKSKLEIERKELFDRGKEVLGEGSGGLIQKLSAAKHGNIALARAAIEQASTMDNPREYIGAITRGSNGKASNALGGFSGLSAKLRQAVAEEDAEFGDYAGSAEASHRR
jgi:hypothetical protein